MVIVLIFLAISTVVAALSPIRVIGTIIGLIKNRCGIYDLVMGILAVPLAIWFYGSKLGFTFSPIFEVLAAIGLFAFLIELCFGSNSK